METYSPTALADRINALLPQTQCTQCGYEGCAPYAKAIAEEGANINRCPPGGEAGITALSKLLNVPILPLDPECGELKPNQVALIDAAVCIGCAKCLPACPVDAILGASKYMHTIIAPLCTGCGLCIPPCPVDCITLVEDARVPVLPAAAVSLVRFQAHDARYASRAAAREAELAEREAGL